METQFCPCFFLGSSLSKALHLTPKMLKSEETFFFDLIREVWLSLEGCDESVNDV